MQPYSIEPQQEEEDRPIANWKRRILIGAACLLGLLVVGWWVISSEMFLRRKWADLNTAQAGALYWPHRMGSCVLILKQEQRR